MATTTDCLEKLIHMIVLESTAESFAFSTRRVPIFSSLHFLESYSENVVFYFRQVPLISEVKVVEILEVCPQLRDGIRHSHDFIGTVPMLGR